ncbi:src-like-adapter isoform X1 [Chiloscyllium plagiosum]|uniref:src-like-adapter isoform X1 n=1 Tax=Chiloscyllium plagiosum TaxID=36176 RepID=UPI001CB7D581|nr:src-like-adapter isoform X1 [Chiloscyllium plagiosum]XP_043543819.1 src-like-adapter isoform X1 [Chiloscyllium plagiosum]
MGNTLKSAATEKESDVQESLTAGNNDMLVMIYDYPPATISQPIFRIGEKLRIIAEEGDWWRVRSFNTGSENYIPRACAARVYHGWLFEGIGRQKAEELLQLSGNRLGSFLIRQSESQKGTYCLSVRCYSDISQKLVKHYRIFRLPNKWYYIQERLTFQCLEDLVNHYCEVADGLCCLLTHPCLAELGTETSSEQPVILRRNQFNWKNVKRAELLSTNSTSRDEAFVSYGLRHSIASYMTLSQIDDDSISDSSKKKWFPSIKSSIQNRHSCLLTTTLRDPYEDDFE